MNTCLQLLLRPLAFSLVASVALCGCKPGDEPAYPYGVVPPTLALSAGQTAAPSLPEAPVVEAPSQASEGQAGKELAAVRALPTHSAPQDAPAAESKDEGDGAQDVPAAPAFIKEESAEGVSAAAPFAASGFAGIKDVLLSGKDAAGESTYLFKANGFFEYSCVNSDNVQIERVGTYRLRDGDLVLAYAEKRTFSQAGEGVPRVSVRQGIEQRLELSLRGEGAVHLGDSVFSPTR